MTLIAVTTIAGDFDLYNKVISSNPNEKECLNSMTDDQYIEYANQFIETNKTLAVLGKLRNGDISGSPINPIWRLHKIAYTKENPNEFRASFDTNFVNAGLCSKARNCNYYSIYAAFPLTVEKYYSNFPSEYNKNRVMLSIYRNNLKDGIYSQSDLKISPAEEINLFVEDAAKYMGLNSDYLKMRMNKCITGAVKSIKRQLRKEGKTFVVDNDSQNPVQIAIDELTQALQAPRCQGTKEWVARWCPDYQWIDINYWLSDEELEKLKDDVFYGEKDLDRFNSSLLFFNLGVDEYNKFIELYNSGKNN